MSKMKTFRNVPVHDLLAAMGATDQSDTGSHAELSKIAESAWKKHLREKHRAGTKHRH